MPSPSESALSGFVPRATSSESDRPSPSVSALWGSVPWRKFLQVRESITIGIGGSERGGAGLQTVFHFEPIRDARVVGIEVAVDDWTEANAERPAVVIGDVDGQAGVR